jgi:hypothetical protein
MTRTMTVAGGIASLLVLLVFTAGFFHGAAPGKECPVPSCPPAREGWDEFARHRGHNELRAGADMVLSAPAMKASGGLLALTNAPGYRRAADMSLRVADCTKAEDDLEARLTAIRGEILDMVMEGTEGSRTCTLSCLIPADKFREFVVELRKMGKVQSERITASKLKPGGEVDGKGEPDPRELSIVAVRMADEKVARDVLESRGVLASSFDKSASHFMKGMAVLIELVGYGLPFAIALLAVALPFFVMARFRRSRAADLRVLES